MKSKLSWRAVHLCKLQINFSLGQTHFLNVFRLHRLPKAIDIFNVHVSIHTHTHTFRERIWIRPSSFTFFTILSLKLSNITFLFFYDTLNISVNVYLPYFKCKWSFTCKTICNILELFWRKHKALVVLTCPYFPAIGRMLFFAMDDVCCWFPELIVNKAKMEPTEETDDAVERRYNELCLDLNMDKGTKEEAWESYQKIKTKYTLEVGQIFACVRYINISTRNFQFIW